MNTIDIIYLIILVICIIFSSIFSCLDMAYSSVKISRLENDTSKASKRAYKYANQYDRTIASILFGNDFVNILASSIGSILAIHIFTDKFGISEGNADLIMSLILLFVILLFGEITPKAIAKSHNFTLSKFFSGFVGAIRIIFFPFVFPINAFAAKLTSFAAKKNMEESTASDEELEEMVDAIEDEGIIDEDQSELIHKTIDFKETSCYEIITPRVKIIGYNIKDKIDKLLKNPDCFTYSRIICYDKDLDHIVGYIPVKDLLCTLIKGKRRDIKKLILPITSVPRTMVISQAMKVMKESHSHILVVRDEFGGTEGIITMEDILEELIGEVWDESDEIETNIRKLKAENTYLVRGNTNIDDFMDYFGLDPDVLSDEYSTVSGFINFLLERFAKTGDTLSYKSIDFEVIKVSNYTVELALVVKNNTTEESEE